MSVRACPFCGLSTGVPHETQAVCIAALHTEIALTRDMVNRVKDPSREPLAHTDEPRVDRPV
jgi:hypothetical protein